MFMKEDKDRAQKIIESKEHNRILINITLLGICFTLFTFIVVFNQDLLKENLFLTLQLVCAIPLFMTSLLAKVKASYMFGKNRWATLGFETYLLAYAFLLNVVGIFLMLYVSYLAGIVFFIVNILSALTYSAVELSYDKSKFKERMMKDIYFILIIVLLGILPAIGFY
jgi:hypothetical protein